MLFGRKTKWSRSETSRMSTCSRESHAEQERALQRGETAAEDEDLWLGGHGSHSVRSIAACAAATRAIGTRNGEQLT